MSLATKSTNPELVEAFSKFSHFKLQSTILTKTDQGHKGNEGTVKNLNHNLQKSLGLRIEALNGENKSEGIDS